MCGIIGYVGNRNAAEVITDGLKRLEYRGYDSVGIAVSDGRGITVKKDKGMVAPVSLALQFTSVKGNIGMGHSRWATHGAPCMENAHPHFDCGKKIVLVHNGVIENYYSIGEELRKKGHKFASETDSEVVAHLFEENLKSEPQPLKSFIKTLNMLHGSYALVAMADGSEQLFVARRNSPLILGIGSGEMFCASDIPAMLQYTRKFVLLEDGDVAVLTRNGYKLYGPGGGEISRNPITVDWSLEMAEKGGYAHFMRKEIEDEKHFLFESFASDVSRAAPLVKQFPKMDVIGCGTSYHAALLFKFLAQSKLGKRCDAVIASEYAFSGVPDKDTLVIAITQSGETADTLQALRFAKSRGAKILALTNVVGSSVTRLADEVVYLNSGPEISVAATKTFLSQLAVVYRLLFPERNFSEVPKIVERMVEKEGEIRKIAEKLKDSKDVFFLGRGISLPVAAEGSLKLKEISYIHAEAYPGGELKHGPLSLVENGFPVVALAPSDETLTKMGGNMKEVKARGAYLIAVTGSDELKRGADAVIDIPELDPLLYPFAMTPLLQLLAYHTSVLRGIDPDKPRNLAKSVTVE